MMLRGKTVLLGVSGGIAAYKAAVLASMLVKAGAMVDVVMTPNALHFITPHTFEGITKRRVSVDTFDRSYAFEVEHIALAKRADLVIIAPATANVIAKLAQGLADHQCQSFCAKVAYFCENLTSIAVKTRSVSYAGFDFWQQAMSYADGVHRQVLFTVGLVLYIFIMIINLIITLMQKKGEKANG